MFDDTLEILSYPTVTERGKSRPDYTATPTSVVVAGVDVQPGASTELIAQQREGSAIRWTVFDPNRTPGLTAQAIVRVNGDVCQVDGRPMDWSGSLGHKVLFLIAWEAS